MHARQISRSLLPLIRNESWVDTDRKPYVNDKVAYIPVKDGQPYTHDLPDRKRTGRGYQRIGDIVAFHGNPPSEEEVEEIWKTGRCKGIIHIHGHAGIYREPVITLLRGEAGEVSHKESGIVYRLDVRRLMFSQGNREEKKRIAGLIEPGEKIADMFAGIGYFTLPMARAGGKVHAMEINPLSFGYLKENIEINNLCGLINAECGDCRDLISGTYDRIHMGFFEAVSFLPEALDHTGPGTVLHLHTIGECEDLIKNVLSRSHTHAEISENRVKKVGPGKWHLVYDLVIT